MSKVGRFWDWLLPGLICLSPMASIAYYSAVAEIETSQRQTANSPVRVVGSERRRSAAAISFRLEGMEGRGTVRSVPGCRQDSVVETFADFVDMKSP